MGRTLRKLFSATAALQQAQILVQEGQPDRALAILEALVAAEPGHAEAWYKQGNALKDLGRPLESLVCYERAIDLQPQYTAALSNRGVVLLGLGRAQEALEEFRRAIDSDPLDPVVRYNCASVHLALDQRVAGMMSYCMAIELRSDYAEAYLGRAILHEQSAAWQTALDDCEHALALGLDLALTHFHRGNALAGLRRWRDALASYDTALTLDANHGVAHLHRGNVLRQLQRWEPALASYERASVIKPDQVDGCFNRGVVLEQLGRLPEAIASFDAAIAVRPDFAPAHYNRALALLLSGSLVEGFQGYEWRWKNREPWIDPREYRGSIPLWSGIESLEGRTILIFSEQGLGDTLQFCRYVRMVAELGAQVVFEVQEPLVDLLGRIEGSSVVVARGGTVPHCDYKCPLLSLPLALGTTVETIPGGRKYLHVDDMLLRSWQARLGARTRPRIGLVWSGNTAFPNDQSRSLSAAQLVGGLPREFEYFCLQKDIRDTDRAYLDANPHIINYPTDFMDAAALCECMDLVISVCTSIAHLAGALGRPLWVLLAFNADWRWLKGRESSPWYSSATLYRQPSIGNWEAVIAKVAHDLRQISSTTLPAFR